MVKNPTKERERGRKRGHEPVLVALGSALIWLAGCDSNEMPVAVGSIPGHTVDVGGTAAISLDRYFSDPDGDGLIYRAES
ncbi:MAG: hypothetical protein J4F34_00755, partial [Gemmatimonadetes bacterium]|nr:hypothetical protein [Gemmatimonadota bacterium]